MKLMVAGTGLFGKEHLARLTAIGGIRLAASDTRTAALGEVAQRFSLVDRDSDAFALVDRFRPDGIVVATPVEAHVPLGLHALALGIPVLIEKPIASDAAGARRLAEAAAAGSAFLQPGHILRFCAAHRLLADLVGSGAIGDLLFLASRRFRDDSHARHYPDIDPVLMTLIHDIDLALWMGGAPAVSVAATRRPQGTARSITSVQAEGANGVIWHLATAWLHPSTNTPADRVEVLGTEGSATLFVGSHIELRARESRRIAVPAEDDPLRTELECFLAGVRAGASRAPVRPEDAVDGLEAAGMILRALADAPRS
ncbi:MAG: Gfo/Idh/MocA family protein [Geminicoccaceae bacterium]